MFRILSSIQRIWILYEDSLCEDGVRVCIWTVHPGNQWSRLKTKLFRGKSQESIEQYPTKLMMQIMKRTSTNLYLHLS